MKRILAFILVAALLLCTTACGGSNPADATPASGADGQPEQKKLVIWAAPALVSELDQKKPQEEWTLAKICRAFEAENPGVTMEIVLNPDSIALQQMFKAAAMSEDGPDIVNVWAGNQLFELDEVCVDITQMIPEQDKKDIIGWDTVTLNFEENGKILGYPTSGNEVCGFFYNKEILAAVGLDYEKAPAQDVEQFVQDMRKLKEAGYLPMVAADGGWNEGFFVAFATWWVQSSGSERVTSNSEGRTTFADDPGFIKAYETAASMYAEGLINTDYASIPSATELFVQGKAAFFASGNWNLGAAAEGLGEDKIGFTNPPDIDANVTIKDTCIGGPGQALVISKGSKNPDLALKFLSFISNKENHTALILAQSKLPLRTDVSAADIGIGETGASRQLFDKALNYVFWADNSMVPDVNAEMQKLGPLAITGKMPVLEMAKALDKKAAEMAG